MGEITPEIQNTLTMYQERNLKFVESLPLLLVNGVDILHPMNYYTVQILNHATLEDLPVEVEEEGV